VPVGGDQLQALRDLLKECAAQIVSPDGAAQGSGFFIDDEHLLTCAHVVKGPVGAEVIVRPFRRQERKGTIVECLPDETDDLALVKSTPLTSEEPLAAVVLDKAMDDDVTYYAVGYPREELLGDSGLEEIAYTANRRWTSGGTSVALLMFHAGQATVTSGLSGGAVLNSRSGAVVGLVQYATRSTPGAGGGAIPITRAAIKFELVRRYLDDPPLATRRWRDVLGQDAWQGLNKPSGWFRTVDVVVGGQRNRWRVKVDPDESDGLEIRVKDFPEELAEALFQWAQRRRIRGRNDVLLLGRLLEKALFPEPVASRIRAARGADELLIRLNVDPDSKLFDVPWEFVTLTSNGKEEQVATESGLGFVRVAAHGDETSVDTLAFDGEAKVLGIVIEPEDWRERMPKFVDPSKVEWPKQGDIMQRLQEAVGGASRFSLIPLQNPIPSQIEEAAVPPPDTSIEVVHYVGFGSMFGGEASFAVSDGEDGVQWRRADDFFSWVADSGARLLVVQFALPPFGSEWDPVPPETFLAALSKRVNAVVFTRFPLHARQLLGFNTELYSGLSEGTSIEIAVQAARRVVRSNEPLGDAAVFGSFALVTGQRADMRLVTPAVSDPTVSGTKQDARPADQAPAEQAAARPDAFGS
jgi:hypothetical protein